MGENPPTVEEGDVHLRWMREAMNMVRTYRIIGSVSDLRITQAEEAMVAKEVPVGCVFVRGDKIIAKARNRTNELRNVRLPLLTLRMPNTYIPKPGNETRRARSDRRHSLRSVSHPTR